MAFLKKKISKNPHVIVMMGKSYQKYLYDYEKRLAITATAVHLTAVRPPTGFPWAVEVAVSTKCRGWTKAPRSATVAQLTALQLPGP